MKKAFSLIVLGALACFMAVVFSLVVGTSWATITTSPDGGGEAASVSSGVSNTFVLKFNGFASNAYILDSTLAPTNVQRGSGLISGTINSHVLTVTSNGFANVRVGDAIVITTSNHQYRVSKKISSSQVRIHEYSQATYSAITNVWQYYPAGLHTVDINGNDAGAAGENDGSFSVVSWPNNSGVFALFDSVSGSNNWEISLSHDGSGDFNVFNLASAATGNPLHIAKDAPYESINALADRISFRKPITNSFTGVVQVGNTLLVTDGSQGVVQFNDDHNSIYGRIGGDNRMEVHSFGGTAANNLGIGFYTGGVKANQTQKVLIADDTTMFQGTNTYNGVPTNVIGTTVKGQMRIIISNQTYYIDVKQ